MSITGFPLPSINYHCGVSLAGIQVTMRDTSSPITRLAPEILLAIFGQLLVERGPGSMLLSCMLTCKQWLPTAQDTLYRDVVLVASTLALFTSSATATAAKAVRTLTLCLDPAEMDRPSASRLLKDLAVGQVQYMKKLRSLSVYQIPSPRVRNGFMIPTDGLAAIVENLTESCTALEIESVYLREHSFEEEDYMRGPPGDNAHLCPSIRKVLPRLEYLRLRLDTFCPDICGVGYQYDSSDPSRVSDDYKPVELPRLKQCVVNIARKWGADRGPYGPSNSTLCCQHAHNKPQPCLSILATHLCPHIKERRNGVIEKLWIMDYQANLQHPRDPNKYSAFVRRDLLTDTSLALPHRDIGASQIDTWHLRRPILGMLGEEWEDVVGESWAIEQLAEGPAWVKSTLRGVRLPAPLMVQSSYYTASTLPVLPKDEFYAKRRLNTVLWANEKRVGQSLLEPVEKELLAEHRDLEMKIPEGWQFPNEGGPWLEKME
ncbi:hypothetical protein F5B20DRAFT_542345 [Whalleya microplaca]|nr:hypothetical protein F5B20DRAFT_542345 [Whalleya microplaca]